MGRASQCDSEALKSSEGWRRQRGPARRFGASPYAPWPNSKRLGMVIAYPCTQARTDCLSSPARSIQEMQAVAPCRFTYQPACTLEERQEPRSVGCHKIEIMARYVQLVCKGKLHKVTERLP